MGPAVESHRTPDQAAIGILVVPILATVTGFGILRRASVPAAPSPEAALDPGRLRPESMPVESR